MFTLKNCARYALVAALLPLRLVYADITVVDPHAIYPEGPVWSDGKLYYVEYAGPGIKVWDGEHTTIFWAREHCGANGLINFGNHHLLVACYDENVLVELDAQANVVGRIDQDGEGKPFIGPNDLYSDGHGGVYFSASGVYDLNAPITGKVLHLSADGGTVKVLADTIHYSNGLTLSNDGKSLLVAEMLAGRILEFPVEADGSLGPRKVWARLQDLAPPTLHEDAYDGPDGLKRGPDGHYYIAQNGSGRVLIVNENKKLVDIIKVPTPFVTNMAFGPDGASTVFVTGAFDQFKPPYPGVVYRWTK
jgi:gluconolactonase